MSDNSFRQELEAEIHSTTKDEFRARLIKVGLILVVCVLGVVWGIQSLPRGDQQGVASSTNEDVQQPPESLTRDVDAQAVDTPPPTSSVSVPQPSAPIPSTAPPSSNGIDRNAFIADGQKTMANYNQIVGLTTLDPSMSDSEKANRIKQAATLDRQYFSQVTNLRGYLVWANVSSGKYTEATELAESGVSKISVGLTFMSYWANDHSRTNDLQGGLGDITQGSNILLQFSQKLNAL